MTARGGERPRALVVGSGAGGAAVARELQGAYQVTVLEEGQSFRPLRLSAGMMEAARRLSPLLGRHMISPVFPAMRIRPTPEGMLLVNGSTVGGSTVLSTGNGMRCDEGLRRIGVNLDAEFEELARELPITVAHRRRWTPTTTRLFERCAEAGLDPRPMPKMVDERRCRRCGRCVLGCPTGAKWDSRRLLDEALAAGARLLTGCRVQCLEIEGNRAKAVRARMGLREVRFEAELIVLCAGGLGTPVILEASDIPCEPRLFVDPVLVVTAPIAGSRQDRELPMPFYVEGPGYLISPYFDYLSYLLDSTWRSHPAGGLVSLMIKLADSAEGRVESRRGRVEKRLTRADRDRLSEAEALCRRLLVSAGADPGSIFLGLLNAGHPGGTLPLGPRDAESLHPDRLPENLYVADASLLPESLGCPPILTILALAKRVARAASAR